MVESGKALVTFLTLQKEKKKPFIPLQIVRVF